MRVVLTSDIDDIGLAGEIKTVRNGLARNFLIPQKLAVEATAANLQSWEKKLRALEIKREKTVADAREFAEKIGGKSVSIEAKLSDGEKMFGSVDARQIAAALKEQHEIEVERRNILLEKNIKSIGRFEVPIRVKANIKTAVIVEVKSQDAPQPSAETEEESAAEQTAQTEISPEETLESDANETGEDEKQVSESGSHESEKDFKAETKNG